MALNFLSQLKDLSLLLLYGQQKLATHQEAYIIIAKFCQKLLTIALRLDDVSLHVCPHLLFILAFATTKNAHLKSLESQFRFVCPHFGSINSNCALRYSATICGTETC